MALETSPNPHLHSRASALHAILHSKHTSLLNARFVNSARASFDYQKKVADGPVKGYRMTPSPTALLQRWYSLTREKRATRQDFLRALVKVFDVELGKSSQVRQIHGIVTLGMLLTRLASGRRRIHPVHGGKLRLL